MTPFYSGNDTTSHGWGWWQGSFSTWIDTNTYDARWTPVSPPTPGPPGPTGITGAVARLAYLAVRDLTLPEQARPRSQAVVVEDVVRRGREHQLRAGSRRRRR